MVWSLIVTQTSVFSTTSLTMILVIFIRVTYVPCILFWYNSIVKTIGPTGFGYILRLKYIILVKTPFELPVVESQDFVIRQI